jgi:hypothetical protein
MYVSILLKIKFHWFWSRYNVVSIVTRLRAGRSGVRIPAGGKTLFSAPQPPDWFRASPIISSGYRGSFPGVKLPRRDFDHPSPSVTDAKNEWSCTSAPPIHFHGANRHNFIFTLLSLILLKPLNINFNIWQFQAHISNLMCPVPHHLHSSLLFFTYSYTLYVNKSLQG